VLEIIALIALSLVSLASAGVLSAEESAISLVARGRARRLVEAERRGAVAFEQLADVPSRVSAAAALTRAVAFALSAITGWRWASGLSGGAVETWLPPVAALLALAVAFSLGEALPRALAVANPEGVGLDFARAARILVTVAYPAARLLSAVWSWGVRLAGGERGSLSPWSSEDEVRSGTAPDEETAREEAEEALLDAASDFAEKVVREVMVPRTDMACLQDTATAEEAIAMVEERGFSRLPIYHGTIDDVRGVLYAKDLLIAMRDGAPVDLAAIARRPYFVPETKPVEELFVEMRRRTHIAVVADEYGGTAGLVTIEDLLEELVGEIFDEYDREEPLLIDLGDGRFRADARLPIDDVNERFDTAIDVDADTIGGVVSLVAGRIPEVGESIVIEGLRVTVAEREPTRVRVLEIEPAGPMDEEDSTDA
jgi:putative hemolysin